MRWALLSILFLAFQVEGRILDFHSDIRVSKSGELTVTERITLEASEGAPGLERELPGAPRIVDVIRNGHPEPWVLDGNRLRIGRKPLARGRHLYQIVYRSTRQVAFLDFHDELAWSIGGVAVERATAEVTLPGIVPRRDIRVTSEHQSFVRDGRAAFRSLRPLAANESMSFAVRFPKDVVSTPGFSRRASWFWDDYKGVVAVLLLLLGNTAVLISLNRQT